MVELEPNAPAPARDEDIDDELSCGCREAWFGFSALGLLRDPQNGAVSPRLRGWSVPAG